MSQLICHYCGHHDPAATLGVRCPADGSVLVPQPEHDKSPEDSLLGRVIGGKYAVIGLIGQGAMGAVYKAMQEPVGREVAIKVIRNTKGEQAEELRSRFLREAKVAARLSNPSAVTLFDYGTEQDGILYMVMEFVRGRTLGATLAADGPFPPERLVAVACQVLYALSEAHAIGLVHRDIKPDNVMLVPGPWGGELAKVLDFGIAKILEAGDDAVFQTRAGLVLGTPLYMAPEQATARELDGRSDLYSVGVMLYQLLTGRLPFSAATPFEVLLAHRDEPVPPFPASPAVPPALQEVVLRSLQKSPADRFPDAAAMAQALLAAVPGVQLPPQQLAGASSARGAALPPRAAPPVDDDGIGEMPTQASSRIPAAPARLEPQPQPSAASPTSPAAAAAAAARSAAEAPTPVPVTPPTPATPATPSPASVPAPALAPVPAPKRGGGPPLAIVLGGLVLFLLLASAGGFFAWRSLRGAQASGSIDTLLAKLPGKAGPAVAARDPAARPPVDEEVDEEVLDDGEDEDGANVPAVPADAPADAGAAAAGGDPGPAADPVPGAALAADDPAPKPAVDPAPAADDPAAAQPERLLFEDSFARANSGTVGQGWSEFELRTKAGKRGLRAEASDWVLRDRALSVWTQAFLGVVEDFAVTPEAYAVEGSRVEFELRGVLPGSDAALYVLWVEDPAALTAGPLSAGSLGFSISAEQGKPVASLVAGGRLLGQPAAVPAGLAPARFARGVLTVQGGKVTWQLGDQEPISASLDQPLAPGERRRLLFGIRATTKVWHKVDVRGLKVFGH